MTESQLERALKVSLKWNGLPRPDEEVAFAKALGRKWRFDFAYMEPKVAIECEGGVWSGGKHSTGVGITRDIEKYNTAALLGWTVLRVTGDMIEDNRAADLIRAVLMLKGAI